MSPKELHFLGFGLCVAIGVTVLALCWALVRHICRFPVGNWGKVDASQHHWLDLAVALGLCLLLVGVAWRGEVGKVNQGTPAGMTSAISLIIGIVCFHGTFLALLWAYFSVLRRKSPSDVFGLQSLPLSRTLRLAVLCLLPAALLATWLNLLSSIWLDMLDVAPREQEAVQILRGASGFSMQLAVAIAACVGAPLQEEFLFRGLLYGSLKRYSGTAFALISSSLLFGAIHMNLAAFLPLTILGFCFALAYEISGCLWVSILMHALFNLGMTIAAIYA